MMMVMIGRRRFAKLQFFTFLHCAFLNEDGKWQYGDGDKDWAEERMLS